MGALLALSAPVAVMVGVQSPVQAAPPPSDLVMGLEQALNTADQAALEALLVPAQWEQWAPRLRRFTESFPNARWQLSAEDPLPDGRLPVAVRVEGRMNNNGLQFALTANQTLALSTDAGRITGQEVLKDQSLLVHAQGELPVTLLIPDTVLIGSRYDVDVVLDEPLGQALLAGGLTALTPGQVRAQANPTIPLEPLGGGGLFKSVQAPLQPGVQTWAATLVHPDGVITVTKQVRVVRDRSQLDS
ncbi:MAG: hypothetical protein ACON4T_02215 [Synechococcus sp.]